MAYNVTSGFQSEISKDAPTLVRRFYIGDSDYSSFVDKFPKFKKQWNEIKPTTLNIKLSNHGKTFNFFKSDPVTLVNSCRISYGVQYAVGSEETLDFFRGKISDATFIDGTMVSLKLEDKMKAFAERLVGTNESPIDYTGSDFAPHEVAWWIATSFGGLSAVESTSNLDIDYAAWLEWAEVFSDGTVTMEGYFKGQKVANVMRRIGRLTDSSIVIENDKLTFARFSSNSSAAFDIGSRCIMRASLNISDTNIINNQIWNAGYDITSADFFVVVEETNQASVNSYGRHSQVEDDQIVWYVDSVSALNIAQRKTTIFGVPIQRYQLETTLRPITRQVGDTISFKSDILDVDEDVFRVMGYELDLDKGIMKIDADASQLTVAFILDDSTMGHLDKNYNGLG